jgi:hypothetical protein
VNGTPAPARVTDSGHDQGVIHPANHDAEEIGPELGQALGGVRMGQEGDDGHTGRTAPDLTLGP